MSIKPAVPEAASLQVSSGRGTSARAGEACEPVTPTLEYLQESIFVSDKTRNKEPLGEALWETDGGGTSHGSPGERAGALGVLMYFSERDRLFLWDRQGREVLSRPSPLPQSAHGHLHLSICLCHSAP